MYVRKIGYVETPLLKNTSADDFDFGDFTHYQIVTFEDATDVCAPHDGVVRRVDEAQVGENFPPFHYGCRCIVLLSDGENVNYDPRIAEQILWSNMASGRFALAQIKTLLERYYGDLSHEQRSTLILQLASQYQVPRNVLGIIEQILGGTGGSYENFLYALAFKESTHRYWIVNEHGFMGLWQLGDDALIDAGFIDRNGNWTDLARSHGVNSREDFLSNPEAQHTAVRAFHRELWRYIQNLGSDQHIGTVTTFVIQDTGEEVSVLITESGLVAAMHLVGFGGFARMFREGVVVFDANGTAATYYMERFGGYDLTDLLG